MTRTSIGAYKVIRRLAGDDELYLVRSTKGRQCRVRLLSLPADGQVLEQLERQTSLSAALDHPAVGKVLDWFDADGMLAVVLEPIDGCELTKLVDKLTPQAPLKPAAVWHLGHQLAGALARAHGAEDVDGAPLHVCHGQLAPGLVMVGYNGFVRLDGIGLASLVASGAASAPARYTAPEQRGGGRVTPRGDLYSLGVLLWVLLSGQELGEEPPALEVVRARLPEAVEEPLGRALQPSLSQRRITAMELEQCLAELADQGGRDALASAMSALRRGGALFAGARAGSVGGVGRRPPMPRAGRTTSPRPGGTPVRRKRPPLGGQPPPRAAGTAAAGSDDAAAPTASAMRSLDWLAASEAVSKPSAPPAIDDEITWGGEGDSAPPAAAPALPAPAAAAAAPVGPGRSAARVEAAAARVDAEDLVQGLDALQVPPSRGLDPAIVAQPERPAAADLPPSPSAGAVVLPAGALVGEPPHPDELAAAPAMGEPQGAAIAAPPAPTQGAAIPAAVDVGATPDEARPFPLWAAAVVTVVTALLTLTVGIWWTRRGATAGPAPTGLGTVAPASAAAAPSGSAGRRAAAPPAGGASASARASTAATRSAAPATSTRRALAAAGPDPASLPPTEGLLVVRFEADRSAEVYVRGRKLGRVGTRLRAPCVRPLFVRLAAPVQGGAIHWLSEGRAGVQVSCRAVTEITMKP